MMIEGSVLGFDVGRRRIGVAIGSALGGGARPVAVIDVHDDIADARQLQKVMREWRPAGCVVGDPQTLSGEDQPIRVFARAFAQMLKREFKIPVVMMDERSSSVEAAQGFAQRRAEGRAKRRDAHALDAIAAAIFVERWIASPEDAIEIES
jgi:putative Holliday junction resolvase